MYMKTEITSKIYYYNIENLKFFFFFLKGEDKVIMNIDNN